MNASTWLDGEPAADCAGDDLLRLQRAFAYGDGLFETIAIMDGRARLLSLHLDRLRTGCRRLAISLDETLLRAEIESVLSTARQGVLKIVVARAGSERGYRPQPGTGSHRLLQFFSQNIVADFSAGGDAVLHLCRHMLSRQPALAGLKHLNRLEQVLARSEWSDPLITDGLMLDAGGLVIETVSSNLFVIRAGQVQTPRLDQCGVAGIMRRVVMEHLQVSVQETALTLDDLYAADEVFVTSSLRGIQPVVQLGCVHWQRGGATIALQKQLQNFLANTFL